MQDNYNWCGPSDVRGAAGIPNSAWSTLQGGDGFVVLQDPSDYRVAFSESQDGNIVRVDRVTGETMAVRPQPAPGEPVLRWHWDTPLIFSPHDPKVVYAAANKVFRSPDRGLSWGAISADLTTNQDRDELETMGVKGSEIQFSRHDGIAAWPAIVSLAESPKRAGLLYAGTDDGNLAVTRDGGKTWTQIVDKVPGVPKGTFVSEAVRRENHRVVARMQRDFIDSDGRQVRLQPLPVLPTIDGDEKARVRPEIQHVRIAQIFRERSRDLPREVR
jgi:hypothetical protein